MVVPSVGDVVTIYFPFSDLTQSKLRPALVLANVDNNDWVLAQITSKPYADVKAICLEKDDFVQGKLKLKSYVRPGKLFTANGAILHSTAGHVSNEKFTEIVDEVIQLFKDSIKT